VSSQSSTAAIDGKGHVLRKPSAMHAGKERKGGEAMLGSCFDLELRKLHKQLTDAGKTEHGMLMKGGR
jgi:hypothetical protein